MQRRVAIAVLHVGVGARRQQRLGRVQVAARCRVVQRGAAVAGLHVRVGALAAQQRQHLHHHDDKDVSR